MSKTVRAADSSILIYGEAGYGKTTVIAKCFSDHVESLKKEPSYNIPLFLPLKNKGCDYSFDLTEFIEEEFDEHFQKASYPFLDISAICFHFYCDGFVGLFAALKENIVVRISKLNETNCSKANGLLSPDIASMKQLEEICTQNGIKAYTFCSEKNDNMNCGQLITEL